MATKLLMGKQMAPDYGIMMGVPGVGKTTFFAGWYDIKTGESHSGAPSTVILGPENNTEADCAKFPKAETYQQLVNQILELLSGEHDQNNFQTVVIDSLDMVEKLIHVMICETAKTINIDAVGQYGAGRKQTIAELHKFEELVYRLVKEKNMSVWYIAHCVAVDVNDPILGLSYQNYELALHKSNKMNASKNFVDKVSTILFANHKLIATKEGFAKSTEQRALYTEFRPGHLAKNRYGLLYELPLFYEQYDHGKQLFYSGGVSQDNLQSGINAEVNRIQKEINQLLAVGNQVAPDILNHINQSISMAGTNTDELNRILNKVNSLVS